MNTRFLKTVLLSGGMAAAISFPALAGTWIDDSVGWKYQNNDGSYSVSCWQWIDGNHDGTAECYYFNADGYMTIDTVVDGYTVNENGAWTVDGSVQTQAAAPTDT